MAHHIGNSPLGQHTVYVSSYDAGLLFAIARSESRKHLGIVSAPEFFGCDVWTGYELSWLNLKGKPQVAVAEFEIPSSSPNIIESKSFKLYLNSFNQTKLNSLEDLVAILERDLSRVAGASVNVRVNALNESSLLVDSMFDAECIDDLDFEVNEYQPNAELILINDDDVVTERLVSHLLKSNCPVTGQPDWASLFIEYKGAAINREGLLRYIVSFREHQDFHEHCVERIFMDLMARCKPEYLSVYARYTRRGGLDINPFRSTSSVAKPFVGRMLRQ